MSYALDAAVPEPLQAMLAQDPQASDGFTILVLTRDGPWPHVAMVSCGELVCVGDRELGLALWPRSTACKNLTAQGRATLSCVVGGSAYALRIKAERLSDLSTGLPRPLACFRATIEAVTGDQAPYAVLESGVTFRLLEPEATIGTWRQVRASLAAAVAVG